LDGPAQRYGALLGAQGPERPDEHPDARVRRSTLHRHADHDAVRSDRDQLVVGSTSLSATTSPLLSVRFNVMMSMADASTLLHAVLLEG